MDRRLEEELGTVLRGKGRTLAIAESCTGGLVCDLITNEPRSSRYFLVGIVTYSNESKVDLLGVRPSTIDKHGAVSDETAREMASGVRRVTGADIGASVTGIAGPGGGTPEKPVGLVYMAVDNGGSVTVERQVFPGSRIDVKRSAAERLVQMILESESR